MNSIIDADDSLDEEEDWLDRGHGRYFWQRVFNKHNTVNTVQLLSFMTGTHKLQVIMRVSFLQVEWMTGELHTVAYFAADAMDMGQLKS